MRACAFSYVRAIVHVNTHTLAPCMCAYVANDVMCDLFIGGKDYSLFASRYRLLTRILSIQTMRLKGKTTGPKNSNV